MIERKKRRESRTVPPRASRIFPACVRRRFLVLAAFHPDSADRSRHRGHRAQTGVHRGRCIPLYPRPKSPCALCLNSVAFSVSTSLGAKNRPATWAGRPVPGAALNKHLLAGGTGKHTEFPSKDKEILRGSLRERPRPKQRARLRYFRGFSRMDADFAGSNPRLSGLSAGKSFPLLPPLPPVKIRCRLGFDTQAPVCSSGRSAYALRFPAFRIRTQPPSPMSQSDQSLCGSRQRPAAPTLRIRRRPLKPEQIEIKVSHCGICHSDLSMLDNDWGLSRLPARRRPRGRGHRHRRRPGREARQDRRPRRPRLVFPELHVVPAMFWPATTTSVPRSSPPSSAATAASRIACAAIGNGPLPSPRPSNPSAPVRFSAAVSRSSTPSCSLACDPPTARAWLASADSATWPSSFLK